MFEKSLYDLIRGLRNHKGNEREYIQNSLRECRLEVRGADMDLKATALLKLIYLEMFGHDMSWASFHVLEVMSSPKYLQKRVGYLGAVQSFRPDTEVLMLATNLLKKDINSALPPSMSLPLITLPHIITSSLALSLLSDLLPRLSHSHPSIRKKTVVALYRLALVYPDTLRPAWPKIKEMLMDDHEDSSVTAAVINVVCELGWRRPQDFLPLAPRLFDLLVDGGNNWMAIKIIKLFATLTPLEPRLIKKLLPPLTSLIRTTPAMSLLYECINGVIQGGILEGANNVREGEEIATLCISKLRGMIMIEGDPNLRYVALLAFNKIVVSHAHLVSQHEDVIISCIDDSDISIRLQALELVAGMVDSNNLIAVVEGLMLQLRNNNILSGSDDSARSRTLGIEPSADSDGEDPEATLRPSREKTEATTALPGEYKISVIQQILDMCSKNTYANITDFCWYLEILVQLVGLVPSIIRSPVASDQRGHQSHASHDLDKEDTVSAIGWELRNVAVRVSTIRKAAVISANSMITIGGADTTFTTIGTNGEGVLRFAVWIVGEFASNLYNVQETLNFLLHPRVHSLPPTTISAYLQSIPKILVRIISSKQSSWDKESNVMLSLLLIRIIRFFEPLTANPNLEVQERSVEFVELMWVAVQAIEGHEHGAAFGPLLLTKAIPSLFVDSDLNPVAPTAQKKVPLPNNMDLDAPLHRDLQGLLQSVDLERAFESDSAEFERFYNHRIDPKSDVRSTTDLNYSSEIEGSSYQRVEDVVIDPEILARKRMDRLGRNKDDPFYIMGDELSSGTSTPFHEIIKNNNGENVDVDSIPIMKLDLGDTENVMNRTDQEILKKINVDPQRISIAMDENIDTDELMTSQKNTESGRAVGEKGLLKQKRDKIKKSLLEVDSSGLGRFSINDNITVLNKSDIQLQETEDADMAKALEEVERLRLEMQRTAERTGASEGTPPEGTLVKKKRPKKGIVKSQISMKTVGHLVIPSIEEVSPESNDMKNISRPKSKKIKKLTTNKVSNNSNNVY